ncbi:hypothetical protein LO772_01545 [Yinghuangia sp. ASG 101]|uniref:hypothetical protein n=1 Tax=Yinghuangia sp. ASG 101 TaxID=2896848 RepID=UPI001E5B5F54|nr:hypothetical protein [Yinghuangia sp. ASG 101]UGQ12323.1 hypothetical protein LO772_01545 [Yinghuangia sp. ASG 101]
MDLIVGRVYLRPIGGGIEVPENRVFPDGTLLVVPKPGEVRTVLTRIAVAAGRGMAAVCAKGAVNRMCLLHELRSRKHALGSTERGTQAREMRCARSPSSASRGPTRGTAEHWHASRGRCTIGRSRHWRGTRCLPISSPPR